MSNITITLEKLDERHGRYVGHVEGQEDEAELTFTWRGEHILSADHTGAPDGLQGTGVAMALVERLVSDAREKGFRSSLCAPTSATNMRATPSGLTL